VTVQAATYRVHRITMLIQINSPTITAKAP